MSLHKQKLLLGLAALLLAALACTAGEQSPDAVEAARQTLAAAQTETAAAAPPQAPPEQPQDPGAPAEEATATPSPAPTIALSATSSIPTVLVSVNTNCRSGPGVGYQLLDSLVIGQQAQVTQRAPQGFNYVLINRPNGGGECWLWLQYATITGDISNLPVATPPPSPTPTFTATPTATATVTSTPMPGTINGTVNGLLAVSVLIGEGACSSTGFSTTVTDAGGNYSFPNVPVGEYCVTLDVLPAFCAGVSLEMSATVTSGNTTTVDFPCP